MSYEDNLTEQWTYYQDAKKFERVVEAFREMDRTARYTTGINGPTVTVCGLEFDNLKRIIDDEE